MVSILYCLTFGATNKQNTQFMELTREQIAAAQSQINQGIEELEFEDSPKQNSSTPEVEVIPETSVERTSELVYVQNSISNALSISRDIIEGLKAEYSGLTITGIQDKDGIKTVANALKRVKDIYRNVDKKREELKAPVLKAGRDIDTEAKELSALLKAVIDPLEAEDSRIKKLIEEDKNKVQREQEKLMNDRLVVLKDKGVVQRGVFYCVGDVISITPDVLKTMTPNEWFHLVNKVEEAHAAEVIRQQKEEAEKEQLKGERERLDKLQQSLLDNRISMREAMITMLGYKPKSVNPFIFDLASPEFPDAIVNLTFDHITQYDDSAFMKYLTENKERFDNAVASRTALKEKHERLKLRGKKLEEIGMPFNYEKRAWEYDNGKYSCYRDTITDLSDTEFDRVVSTVVTNISLWEEKKKLADQEEQTRLVAEKAQAEKDRIAILPCVIELETFLDTFQSKYSEWVALFPRLLFSNLNNLHDSAHRFIYPEVEEVEDDEQQEEEQKEDETFGDESQF